MSYERTTPCGTIAGTTCQWPGVTAYKGIRYATAKRWEYPQQVTSWEGTYDATSYGAACFQPRSFYDETTVPERAFYYNEFRKGEHYTYSEDCLFLNIWTPEDAVEGSNLPVILYIHGGSFTGGCGNEKHLDGPVWPTLGAVAVTINYRLGPLGFCCLPELASESGHTGNYGLFDQLCAIQWVHDNIAAFGGDPANITIMGQSAGAMSVQQLCLSPKAEGLVARAVMSSGGGVIEQFGTAPDPSSLYPFWQGVMQAAGCSSLEEFRALEPQKLFELWQVAEGQTTAQIEMPMTCVPVMDGELIVRSATETLKTASWLKIPYLIGSTKQDIFTYMLYQMAVGWAGMQVQAGGEPSYAWHFERQLPGDSEGAWHSSDLWYWLGTLDKCWRPLTSFDHELSKAMAAYLVNFARSGNPNGEGLPAWEPIDATHSEVMMFGDTDVHSGMPDAGELQQIMAASGAMEE